MVSSLAPWVLEVLRWGGVVYLTGFALSSFRSALRPAALKAQEERPASSVAATTLALTWLNPHVYLDTVVMLGSVSFRSALRPAALKAQEERPASSVAATTLALTWLNPHVYLDTVVMLGSVTNQFGQERWVAAAGAITASAVWFIGLGLGARALSRPLSRPATWRVLDVIVGLIMLVVAVHLAL